MAFSDNFEVLKEAAAGVAQTAAKKTKLLALIAKDNLAVLAEEDKIKKAQTELGKLYYKDFIMDEEPDEAEYLPWCDKITESRKVVETLKEEIEKAKEELGGDADEDDFVIVPVEVAYPEPADAEDAAAEEAAADAEAVCEEVEAVIAETEEEVPVCEDAPAPDAEDE